MNRIFTPTDAVLVVVFTLSASFHGVAAISPEPFGVYEPTVEHAFFIFINVVLSILTFEWPMKLRAYAYAVFAGEQCTEHFLRLLDSTSLVELAQNLGAILFAIVLMFICESGWRR